jgi:phenylalanyl-tRNA synthetase beta chain
LGKFLHIIEDAPRYPVIYDKERRVLSLPPIINGDHSKIRLTTKNVFIECTATDYTKAKVVLNTIVTMFSLYCAKPFTVEPVEVVYPDGSKHIVPDLSCRKVEASVDYINKSIGIQVDVDEIAALIQKMSCEATVKDAHTVVVDVPPTRSDILHACDVMEDVAIAYNFNRIPECLPQTNTIAVPFPINKLGDMLRKELALAGYTEVLAFTLVTFYDTCL